MISLSTGCDQVLLNHKQESLADHVDPAEVLKCLNIKTAASSEDNVKKEEGATAS